MRLSEFGEMPTTPPAPNMPQPNQQQSSMIRQGIQKQIAALQAQIKVLQAQLASIK